MDRLHLLATIAGERVAFDATGVDSVVEIDHIVPVPRAPAHIAGIAPLRSRVLTVIDCDTALGRGSVSRGAIVPAIVVTVEGHLYGLLVDSVDDVVAVAGEPIPVRARLAAGWAKIAREAIEHEGALLLRVDPAALVAGTAALAA